MIEKLGYDNDPGRGRHEDEEIIRWRREMYLEFLEEERHLKNLRHRDEGEKGDADHGQSLVEGVEEQTAVDHHGEAVEHHTEDQVEVVNEETTGEAVEHHTEDQVEVVDEETTVEHLKQFDIGDGAVARHAAPTFQPWKRKVRNRINGEDWAPPYKKELFMPVFVNANPVQPEADPGYDDWIPYHEEEP